HELVDEVARLNINTEGESVPITSDKHKLLKQTATEIVDAKNCQELLDRVTKANRLIEQHCATLIQNARVKHDKLGQDPNESEDKQKRRKHILDDIDWAIKNSRLPTTKGQSFFKFTQIQHPIDRVEVKWNKRFGATFLRASMEVAHEYREGTSSSSDPAPAKRQTVDDRLTSNGRRILLKLKLNPIESHQSESLLESVCIPATQLQTLVTSVVHYMIVETSSTILSSSAAFNLNTPLIDDIEEVYLKNPVLIGTRAIRLAVLGGFDKVTWDGASDSYPSIPMLKAEKGSKQDGQLQLSDALTLVHKAHSVGLTTYFSAGFKLVHIEIAVYSGVDGVGIGGAQVLRGMDHTSGMHGEYQESRIEELLRERDTAANSPRGLAAELLARLDQMFFEGSINEAENEQRKQLFEALKSDPFDQSYVQKINTFLEDKDLQEVKALSGDMEYLWVGRALRLLQQRGDRISLLRNHGVNRQDDWHSFESTLTQCFEEHLKDRNRDIHKLKLDDLKLDDIELEGAIHSLSLSSPWNNMRKKYQKWAFAHDDSLYVAPPKASIVAIYFKGEIDVALKTTPFGDPKSQVVSDLNKP
ncbi:hypothetical protein FRC07_007000, partial [Ceratobasidium sp. 392]